MNLKKVVAMALSMAMLAGMLTGCGEKPSSEVSKESSVSKQESETQSVEVEKSEETVEKPVITWYIRGKEQADMDLVEAEINKMLEGRLDATVDFIFPASLNETINMMTTAGEEFDLAFGADWLNPSYPSLATKGALLDITDLLDEYGSAIKATIPEDVLEATKINGGLYAVPNYQTSVSDPQFLISKELVDKYNIDLDSLKGSALDGTAPEKVGAILETIKQNEPDKFPFYITNTGTMYAFVASGLEELAQLGSWAALDKETGEIVSYLDYYEEICRLACEWYDKGYIRKDIATVSDQSGDLKAGRYAAFVASDAREGNVVTYGSTYGIEGEVAYVGLAAPYANANHPQAALTIFSRTSKHPELAMQLVNLMYEDEKLHNTFLWGIEGTHWTMNADGTIKRTEAGQGYSIAGWLCGNTYGAYVEEGNDPSLPQKEKDYMASAQASILNGFIFDNTNVVVEQTNCATVKKEFSHLYNGTCGLKNFDKEWARFEDAMKAAGYDTLLEEIIRQVDEFKANK